MNRRDQQIALAAALGGGFDATTRFRASTDTAQPPSLPRAEARHVHETTRSIEMSDTVTSDPDDERTPSSAEQAAAPGRTDAGTTRKLLLFAACRVASWWRARATARYYFTIAPLLRRNRRRLRQRQPRATHAASHRHGDRGQRRRHADRQAGRPARHARPRRRQGRALERRSEARPDRAPSQQPVREQRLLRRDGRTARSPICRARTTTCKRRLAVAHTGAVSEEEISHARDAVQCRASRARRRAPATRKRITR